MTTDAAVTPPETSKALAKPKPLESLFDIARPRLMELVQSEAMVKRLVAVTLNCVGRTPLLRQCDPASIIRSVVQLAEIGLEPGSTLGDGYLVPFRTKSGGYEAQPIPGYRGLVRLALEEKLAVRVDAVIVRKGDFYDYDDSTLPPRLIHRPIPFSDEPMIGVYCVISTATVIDGHMIQTQKVEPMSRKQVDAIKDRSRAKNGPWQTDYEEMAKKTVFKRVAKWLGLRPSSKLGQAIELDDQEDDDVVQQSGAEREESRSRAVASFDESARRMADAATKAHAEREAKKKEIVAGEIPPAEEEPLGPQQEATSGAGLATGDGPNPGGPKEPSKKKRGAKAAKEAIDRALSDDKQGELPTTTPPPVKCDGEHGEPECADPRCWIKDDPTLPPENESEPEDDRGDQL